jgi:ppGpp synthetase/RelA/SpoT-type nucleotidyltranferase
VTEKPLSPELIPQEIEQLQKTLESPPMIDRLNKTQDAILNILESKSEIEKHISNFRKREAIKCIDSVIGKINDHRRAGETYYDSACLKDLIGAQIICPYPDDVQVVINWLYGSKGGRKYFRIVENKRAIEKKRQEREDKTGYRAYHVCLKLKANIAKARSLPGGSENEQFELQIKTALDAGWDFKTHDITYRAFDTDPNLQHHMKLISDSLGSIDNQTLLLRNWIVEEQNIRRELRELACRLIFYGTLKEDQKVKLGIEKINIEQRQQSDIDKLEHALGKYHRSNGIDINYTIGLALIALCCDSWLKQEQSLSCASYLVKQAEEKDDKEEYLLSLRIRALLRWAFHKTRHAVDDMRYVMQVTKEHCDINDYVYYVSELYEVTDDDMQLAKECVKELQSSNIAGQKDTLGAYYIRFGENIEELRYGLNLVREAKELAQGSHLELKLDAFCSYHEYLFLRQFSKLQRIL